MLYEDGARVTNTYDPVSERLTVEDSSNSQSSPGTTTFSYDETKRLKTDTYPANKTITYSFDEVGNRSVMVDPDSGRTTYSYNNGDSAVQETPSYQLELKSDFRSVDGWRKIEGGGET